MHYGHAVGGSSLGIGRVAGFECRFCLETALAKPIPITKQENCSNLDTTVPPTESLSVEAVGTYGVANGAC